MSESQTPEPGTERTLRSSVRNPRRRQRQSDVDTLRTAPRKRSKISEDTFVPPRHDEEDVNGTIEVATTNGDIHVGSSGRGRGRPRKVSAPTLDMEIPMRAKKSSVKRPTRGDGATVLTQNEHYSVKLLPSTPKELRREGVEYRGSLGAGHHALAVTRDRAYIWEYTSHALVNNPRVFDVPFPVKISEPLPFGVLVPARNSTELGLLLISTTSGRVVYYESIERAASLGLFQERNAGVEGSLGSLFSGETVVGIISADHAGFIVTLSSGRLIQLTLRDAQGKARIFAQFLRATEQSSGGLFGSIKGILGGGGWRKDVSALHTRSLGMRGQMQAISLTEKAELQIWDIDWSGRYSFNGTVDCKEMLTQELKKLESPEMQEEGGLITTLEFAILEQPTNTMEVSTLGAELPINIALLLRKGTKDSCNYVVAEITVNGQDVAVNQLLELETYSRRSNSSTQSKPRLLIPKPGHTAIVAFEHAIILAATNEAEADSPEAQLHASYIQPTTFEDTIYVKQGERFAILDACEEESRGGQASSIAFVKGAGLVRVSVVDSTSTELMARVPVKSKIEQAVFHGILQESNIIDFSRIDDSPFSPQEVEKAALEVSDEILRSTSPFISTSPTSMETHLTQKAQALRALITHVRQNYPTLSQAAMWRLLWDAERVAAGHQMWKTFEEHVENCSQTKRKATVMDELCVLVQRQTDADSGDVRSDDEVVRSFFIYKLHYIYSLLRGACNFLQALEKDTEEPSQKKVRLATEADEIWLGALEAVFAFRTEHAAAYGIPPEFMDDGILRDVAEYAELPEFWTSTESMLRAILKVCKLSRECAVGEYEKSGQFDELKPLFQHLNSKNPRLVQLMCLVYQERINWLASRPTEKDRELAEGMRSIYEETRYDHFRDLAYIGESEAGMKLAEKYRDMQTLTEMVLAEMQYSNDELAQASESQKEDISDYMNKMVARVGNYFDRFGDDWANAYFDEGLSGARAGLMLAQAQECWPDALTRYLRAEPSRAKMCWINDLTAEKDFAHATQDLLSAANDHESRLWSKRVELSLAKLALLATQEDADASGTAIPEPELTDDILDNQLAIIGIQDRLYKHFLPDLLHCIDYQAEVEEIAKKFAIRNQDLHGMKQLLVADLERILAHDALSVDDLIDVLTLMDCKIMNQPSNLQGAEFYLALVALDAAAPSMPPERLEMLLQLIWKRCYLYDEWVDINGMQKQSDEQVNVALKLTVPYYTLYHIMDTRFIHRPGCHVRLLRPSECLGAGCSPEELTYRWSDPDLLDSIVNENKIQDEQLQGLVTDRNLDAWIATCRDIAWRMVVEKTDDKAQRVQKEQEFEASLLLDENDLSAANGHANVPNGTKMEGEGDYEDGIDGDVEMA